MFIYILTQLNRQGVVHSAKLLIVKTFNAEYIPFLKFLIIFVLR